VSEYCVDAALYLVLALTNTSSTPLQTFWRLQDVSPGYWSVKISTCTAASATEQVGAGVGATCGLATDVGKIDSKTEGAVEPGGGVGGGRGDGAVEPGGGVGGGGGYGDVEPGGGVGGGGGGGEGGGRFSDAVDE